MLLYLLAYNLAFEVPFLEKYVEFQTLSLSLESLAEILHKK